eukprot:gene35-626_t
MERYLEEQTSEIEALESIYADEIQIINEDPHCFLIPIQACDQFENDEEINADASIQFTFTEKYPDEIPLMEIASSNLNEKDQEDLLNVLRDEATNNIGMVMIFTLVSIVQDYLESVIKRVKEEKDEAKRLAEIELRKEEEKKYHGTPVTVESFTKWKISFNEEIRKKSGKKQVEEIINKKLTGRMLFETDSTLQFSDAQFYTEVSSSTVEVDESLFQELDDFELDDD